MKKIISVILLMLLVLVPTGAFALTAEISSEQLSVECGDSVFVDVVYRGESVGAVRAAFTYDASMMEYIGGEGSTAAGGQGTVVLLTSSAEAKSLKTTLEFRAIHAGTAELTLTTKEALSFDEKALELPEAQMTVKVRKDADSYVVVTAGEETMHALCRPPYIPAGYAEKEIEIAEKKVTAACIGDLEYIYLTMPEETEGGYYLRREGEYLPTIELTQESILLPFPEDEVPEGWKKESLKNGKESIEVCTDGEAYLICTMGKDGKSRITAIDPETMILESREQMTLTQTQYLEKQAEYNYTMIYVLSGVLCALLIAIIVTAICKRKR